MDKEKQKKIAQNILARVSTGLSFIEFKYLDSEDTPPDAAWIRNAYILLSFYTELLLKSIIVLEGNFPDEEDLDRQLKNTGHNLCAIKTKVPTKTLSGFGIKDIIVKNHEYYVETDFGNFYVKDFNDIRYDFIENKTRILKGNENKEFKEQIEIMCKIASKLKGVAYS